MIEIENHDETPDAANGRDDRDRREQLRRVDDAAAQCAEIELLRLQRAEISNRVWIALLTLALAIITALTSIAPLLLQQYAAQRTQPIVQPAK